MLLFTVFKRRKNAQFYGVIFVFRYIESGVYNGIVESTVVAEILKQLNIQRDSLFLWPVYAEADIKLMKKLRGEGTYKIEKKYFSGFFFFWEVCVSIFYGIVIFFYAVSDKQYKRLCDSNKASVKNLWQGTATRPGLSTVCSGFPLLVHTYLDTPPPNVDPTTWVARYCAKC